MVTLKNRMRTIKETMKHIKENDPDTKLTEHALRGMVKSGRIPSNYAGRKYLINIDLLDQFLQSDAENGGEPDDYGKVRRQSPTIKFPA